MTTIPGFNGAYLVDRSGKIYKNTGDKIVELKPCANSWGYMVFNMSIDGFRKSFKVHRVVAEAFIPNPLNLPQVNHKDGDKTNNNASNLEWCTNEQNNRHKSSLGLSRNKKKRVPIETTERIAKERIELGTGCVLLSRKYGVSIQTAFRITRSIK